MKKHIHPTGIWIAVALMALMVACNPPKEKTMEPMAKPSVELAAIDSLMWRQPDSAFAQLLQFAASPKADSLDVFNGHYCQLLISELLYKKDYGQSNREDLLKAVDYFDSLCDAGSNKKGDAMNRFLTRWNVFLDARAHYINGVGYYERGNVEEACAEYLKALEVMEGHFDDKALVGKRAIFMTYTYNRLMELFSAQFMMDPAIACGEKALSFCRIEPTSSKGVSGILYHLGKQYDKMDEMDKARQYYEEALENMTNTNSLLYRDIVSSKALCDYSAGDSMKLSLDALRNVAKQAKTENELLNRFLTIGGIYKEEGIYDSAMYYLEPVFEKATDVVSQIRAGECLRIVYDSIGDKEKSDKCMRFLTERKKLESENKTLVSKLEELFKTYMNQKQEKQAVEEREKAIKKTMGILIPIAVAVALAIIIVAKFRGMKLLKKQQKEANRMLEETERQHEEELKKQQTDAKQKMEAEHKHHAEAIETERQTHRIQQAALSGRLKRSNEELRELKDIVQKQEDTISKLETHAVTFTEEPICRLIMERVNEGRFKSKVDYVYYKDYALDKQHLLDLRVATDRHFGQFTTRLKKAYPELTKGDLDYCCLYLLGLTDADIAALMQRAYNTVVERDGKLKKIFGEENTLSVTLRTLANDSSFV